jgi:Hint domain
MSASKQKHPSSPARRHFLAVSAAFTGKVAGVAALASMALPSTSNAAPGNGNGWGQGAGGGQGHGGGGPQCFLKGTRILTSQGETPIEHVKIGDLVSTARGEELPIKWIGRHTYRRSGTSWHKSVMPIRVSRFAIDDQTPHSDLYLSPLHALFIDGYLMPVRDLVNGISIAPAVPPGMETLEYFQILLNTHEVIWAEGASAETFGGEDPEGFTNFIEYKRLYPNDPYPATSLVAPNLGTGRAHLRALLGLGASYFIDVRDPLQEAYEKIAARAEELVL